MRSFRLRNVMCGLLAALFLIIGPASAWAVDVGAGSAGEGNAAATSESADATAAAPAAAPVDVTGVAAYPERPSVSASNIILLEARSNTVLYSKNATEKCYPASITKIMTALLVIENCSLDEVVTFSYRATHELEAGSSSIARTEGEQMTVRDCLYCMMVASANEVAQALAEHVSGSFEAFADLMNRRAQELGCVNTHFTNPSGLHSDQHYTCCLDMALIMAEAIRNPVFVEIDSTTSYTVPATNKHSESFGVAMKHELLRGSGRYKYAVCGKTGYTGKAAFTLVTYAAKDDLDLICVALRCDDSSERATSSKTLFDYGFNNFSIYNLREADPSMSVGGGSDSGFLSSDLLSLEIPESSYIVLPEGVAFDALTSDLKWNRDAGITGEIARVEYYYGRDLVGSAPLTVNTSAEDEYAFLTDGTYGAGAQDEDDDSALGGAGRLIMIAVIVVLALVVAVILVLRFINGSRRRKRRRTRVSSSVRRPR